MTTRRCLTPVLRAFHALILCAMLALPTAGALSPAHAAPLPDDALPPGSSSSDPDAAPLLPPPPTPEAPAAAPLPEPALPQEGASLDFPTGAPDPAPAAPAAEPCAILDDPTRRGMMSAGLETALLSTCGRQSELTPLPETAGTFSVAALGSDVLVNNPAGDAAYFTQSNAVIAYNETNGVLCAAYTDTYHALEEGGGYTGFSSSSNGGQTWVDRGSLHAAGSYGYPSLVWRRSDGAFYLTTLYNDGVGLWSLGPTCSAATWIGVVHNGTLDDLPKLAVDNRTTSAYYGYLYAVWTNFTDGHIYSSRSSNAGAAWSAPLLVSSNTSVNGPFPAVDPVNGSVYVAWLHWDIYPDGPIDIELARSTNGAGSWTARTGPMSDQVNPRDPTATTACGRPALKGNIRHATFPQIAVGPDSALHAVYTYDPDGYAVGDTANIYYRRSTDGGGAWQTQLALSTDWTYADQFFPTLAVAPTNAVAVSWYDRRLDPDNLRIDRYMALSTDGGVSFAASTRLSDVSSPVVPAAGLATCFHGDYDVATAGAGTFFSVWSDDRRDDADIWSDSQSYAATRLYGTIYAAATGRGLAGALVKVTQTATGLTLSARTDAIGYYEIPVPGDSAYSVTAVAYGYAARTAAAAVAQVPVQLDLGLSAVASYSVAGRVTDAATGYPVYAQLTVTGDPLDPPAPLNTASTDPATGNYSLASLAAGLPYTLQIDAVGYAPQTYALGSLSANRTNVNFALTADLTACTAPGYQMTPPCQVASGAVLQPARLLRSACAPADQTLKLTFANHTGASGTFNLSYAASAGATRVAGPDTLGTVASTAVRPFDVTLKLDRGAAPGSTAVVTVTAWLATNASIRDTTVITLQAAGASAWETRAASPAASMDGAVIAYGGKLYTIGGYSSGGAVDIYDPATDSWASGTPAPSPAINFPVDACFGYITPSDPTIFLLPDANSAVTGIWHRYHIATNTWDTAALPAALPAVGIWAPDIVVDPRANTCYISGGATVGGSGNLTTLYRFDPASNSAVLLGNFTHIPAGFDFHAGWYVPWIGTAGGICVGGGVDSANVAHAETQCYDIAAATFRAANADLGPLPEPWWGMADAELVHEGDAQLWIAEGINAGSALLPRSAVFSRAAGRFVYGPNPVQPLYRVEGAAVDGVFYIADGSLAGFSPSSGTQALVACPACSGVSLEKRGPAWAYPGDTVAYTIVLTRPTWVTGTVQIADVLPTGLSYAGGLSASFGSAAYDAGTRTISWSATPQTGSMTPGAPIEIFNSTWATQTVGLAYNPETGFVRYVHEGVNLYYIHDLLRTGARVPIHSFSLSTANPGWPTSENWRTGISYDATSGHYYLTDYGGGGAHSDNLVETDATGRVLHAWETSGTGNDSYDGTNLSNIADVAVVPGAPTRAFVTRLFDGGTVYALDLIRRGLWQPLSWGLVYTFTVASIGDTAGIEYDDQNGVLYHSSWGSDMVAVTDLRGKTLATFTCANGPAGYTSAVNFIEGVWPPEVWTIDYRVPYPTARCQALGSRAVPGTVTISFNATVSAPVSTTLSNAATLSYRGVSLEATALPPDAAYLAGTWSDTAIHVLDAAMRNLARFPAYAPSPNGMAADSETIWSGHFSNQVVVAHDYAGNELYRWSAPLSSLQGMELVNGELAIYRAGAPNTIEFRNAQTGALLRTIPGQASIEGLAYDGALLWQLDDAAIYGTALDGSIAMTITNAAASCSYGGTGIASPAPGQLTLACDNGSWYRVSSANGAVLASGNNGLTMYGLAAIPPRQLSASTSFHVEPRTALTWTKEIYVNGTYMGRYDQGPFSVVPTDDVQVVDVLEYAGRLPLFVTLNQDWTGLPLTLLRQTHSQGAVLSTDGDWAVTIMPGTSVRLAKTLRVTSAVPVTFRATLSPEGMTAQQRAVTLQPPAFAKAGPSSVTLGAIVPYTLTLSTLDPLVGTMRLTDTLPSGLAYEGGLTASYGEAWAAGGSIYWTNTPASKLTTLLAAPAAAAPGSGEAADVGPASVRSLLAALASPDSPLAPAAPWLTAAAMPTGRVRYARAQCPGEPNRFYVISGVPLTTSAPTLRYDAETNTWTKLAPMPTALEGPSAVCYEGRIYVAGGGGTDLFHIYDIAADSWTLGPKLPRKVWGAAFGAWDGLLFLAGGDSDFVGGGQSNQVNIYSIAAGAWTATGAAMPVATSAPGWVQVGEYLYVVGGWGDSTAANITATQRYHLPSNSWSVGPTFTSARADFALAATDQYLYAIGGDANLGGFFDAATLVERLDRLAWSTAWTPVTDALPKALTAYSGGFCTTARSSGEVWSVGGMDGATWQYTAGALYRPSELCWAIPSSVTIKFNARVLSTSGDALRNTATLNYRGTLLTAQALVGQKVYLPLTLRNMTR